MVSRLYSILQGVGKYTCKATGRNDTYKQPALKGLGNLFFVLVVFYTFVAKQRNHNKCNGNSKSVCQNHRYCYLLYKSERIVCIVHICDKYQQHMDDFAKDCYDDAIAPYWLFIVKHILAHKCRKHTCKDRCYGTGDACVCAGTPVYRKPAVYAPCKACNYACRRTEDKPCTKWRSIAHIGNCAHNFKAVFRCKSRHCTKKQTYCYLSLSIGKFFKKGTPVKLVDGHSQQYISRYGNKQS